MNYLICVAQCLNHLQKKRKCQTNKADKAIRGQKIDEVYETDSNYKADKVYKQYINHKADKVYEPDSDYKANKVHKSDNNHKANKVYKPDSNHKVDKIYESDINFNVEIDEVDSSKANSLNLSAFLLLLGQEC